MTTQRTLKHANLFLNEVEEVLLPAKPDNLEYGENGTYEAWWYDPVPSQDKQAMQANESLDIVAQYNVGNYPGWLVMVFHVYEL